MQTTSLPTGICSVELHDKLFCERLISNKEVLPLLTNLSDEHRTGRELDISHLTGNVVSKFNYKGDLLMVQTTRYLSKNEQ